MDALTSSLARRWRGLVDLAGRVPAILRHRLRSQVIAAPGFLGFGGGLYNPGSLMLDSGQVILLAHGQQLHWIDCQGERAERYGEGGPVLITLGEDLSTINGQAIRSFRDFTTFEGSRIEDYRLFRFEGRIWVNHGDLQYRQKGDRPSIHRGVQTLSILDPTGPSLTRIGTPRLDFETSRIEKNWLFVESGGDLYLLYSCRPYRVLKLSDRQGLSFSTVVNQDLGPALGDTGGYGTMVSFSTNPIDYDDEHFLMLIHQVQHVDRDRGAKRYHQWAVLLDRQSLLPMKISSEPLCRGRGARGRLRTILYVMSVLRRGDEFVLFCGEGDSHLTRMTLNRADLEACWRSLN